MRLHRARRSTELRKVVSGSATQSLWLRNRKEESQVSGIDRNRLAGKGTVRKLGAGKGTVRELGEEEDEEEEPAIEQRRE